jgi:hypothetical protein
MDVPTEADVMVLARDAEETFAAIGPVSDPEAIKQIREQVEGRGWAYLGTAPVVTATEFRQQTEEAKA